AIAYTKGGLPGLIILRVVSLSIALYALNRALRHVSWPVRDAFIAAAVLMSMPLLGTVRPQIFSFPLYALAVGGLLEDARWLPVVFLVWANLHGGWLIGLGAVVVRTVVTPTKRRVLVALSSAAATLITPYGFSLWRSLADAVGLGWSEVVEWQPVWRFSYGVQDAILSSLLPVAAPSLCHPH